MGVSFGSGQLYTVLGLVEFITHYVYNWNIFQI